MDKINWMDIHPTIKIFTKESSMPAINQPTIQSLACFALDNRHHYRAVESTNGNEGSKKKVERIKDLSMRLSTSERR